MDSRLRTLIADYQSSVARAIDLLQEAGIGLPASNVEWACNGISQRGQLSGRSDYIKHGYGCVVRFPSHSVDFDFGAEGQTNGFDLWRLSCFAEDKLSVYRFTSEEELKHVFEESVRAGEIVYSGYILHYLAGHAF